ncbi:MAG: hypothetical protein E7384_04395 [Ruminococcaceae bacterium]|nr:hypothetical protein [Oscillospiraceae bacterium]
MDWLKKINFDRDVIKSVFSRSSTFYAVITVVLVSVSLFTYICGTNVEKNILADKNAALSADKSSLISEGEEKDKIIASQEKQNALLEDENKKLESEKEQIKADSDAKDEANKETLDGIMDYLGMEASRSGGSMYSKIDKIDTVSYIIREKMGDTEGVSKYLQELSDIKSDLESKAAAYPDCDPLEHGTLTSRFGYRVDPNGKGTKYHSGIDVWNSYGTPIYAAGAGKVITAGSSGEYGLLVVIDHGNGYKTVYAHCSSISVSAGDTVSKGQFIARIGATGNATGNHLHFEIKYHDERVNPLDYVFPEFS